MDFVLLKFSAESVETEFFYVQLRDVVFHYILYMFFTNASLLHPVLEDLYVGNAFGNIRIANGPGRGRFDLQSINNVTSADTVLYQNVFMAY